jgi:hypothetical protein
VSENLAEETYLIYAGTSFRAEWYFTADFAMPALEYYKQLSEPEQDRFDFQVRYFCDRPYGQILPKEWYRIEDKENKIYVLKPWRHRYFNFLAINNRLIITNAYGKKSQKMTRVGKAQLAIAARFKADFLKRNTEGTYYAEEK